MPAVLPRVTKAPLALHWEHRKVVGGAVILVLQTAGQAFLLGQGVNQRTLSAKSSPFRFLRRQSYKSG